MKGKDRRDVFLFFFFFLPILCSVNSDHDNRVGVWHIHASFKTKKVL